MEALALLDGWDVPHAAAIVTVGGDPIAAAGPVAEQFAVASLTKPVAAYGMLVAVEEGSVGLDDPTKPDGATLGHLLAHASGLPFDGTTPIAAPGDRRIYSNAGYDTAAAHVEAATGIDFVDYLDEAVLTPLGLTGASLAGSAARDLIATADDLTRFLAEVRSPTLLAAETVGLAVTPRFPDLAGVVPEVGRFDPNPWGYGFEIRGDKAPHWTGTQNSARTFGHFGGSGTFFWHDPDADVGVVCLTDRPFGPWALEAWPTLSDAVIAAVA